MAELKPFFDSLRASFGPLSQNQVDGIELLLQATVGLPLRHQAYILATAWHETGPAASNLHMTPRREIWGPTPAQRRYEGRVDLGNTQPGDGKRFMGRGYVQITGRHNYHRASNIVGRDLVKEPDLALDPAIAARIIVHGMVHGWFTGKKMADFDSYVNMRRVVNGTDRADLIAGYAEKFEAALKLLPDKPAGKPVPPAPAPIPPPEPETPPAPLPDAGRGIAAIVLGAAGALIAALAAWMMKG
jgi:predicted chitinase